VSAGQNVEVSDCIFCAIASGKAQASFLHRDDRAVAIEDLHPAAPTHFLVIPVEHHATISDLRDPGLLAHLFEVAHQVAADRGLSDGYRLVFNQGPNAGQTVYHVHMHVLGGRHLGWPPG
jgi:histidine triad (HIT) family protein